MGGEAADHPAPGDPHPGGPEDLSTWRDRIESQISWPHPGPSPLNRVMVLAETGSTQDAAMRLCEGKPGLVVVAARQTKGRGRLGRAWADTSHLGVAMTFVLDGKTFDDAKLSLAGGVAASMACGADIETYGGVRMRWPNDVVEEKPPHRKIAGVLIERSGGLALVGIGINVLQQDSDWPAELGLTAVSLRRLGNRTSRVDVAASLTHAMLGALASDVRSLVAHWRWHDMLIGTHRSFVHNNHQYHGLVVDIDPFNSITVRLSGGREVSLPAHSTSLVHGPARPPGRIDLGPTS